MENYTTKTVKYFSKLIYYLVPTFLFLPLIIQQDFYFPFITPRNFAFRIIVEVIFAVYLILLLKDWKRFSPGKSQTIIVMAGLFLWMTITSLINGDFLYSFWSSFERMEGLIHFYHVLALLVVLVGVFKKSEDWLNLLRTAVWVSFVIASIAVTQAFGIDALISSSGGSRVSSVLGNPTFVASYALFHIFFAAILWSVYKSSETKVWTFLKNIFKGHTAVVKKMKAEMVGFFILDAFLILFEIAAQSKGNPGILSSVITEPVLLAVLLIPQLFILINNFYPKFREAGIYGYFFTLILINLYALFKTETRGALVGLLVSLMFMAVILLFRKNTARAVKQWSVVIFLLVILATYSIFAFKDSNFIQNSNTLRRIANISIQDDVTTRARFLTWQAGYQGFLEKPIHGWGEEKFYVVFNKYFPSEIFRHAGSRVWFDRAHNSFVEYLVEGGIIGFVLYLGTFLVLLWRLFKRFVKQDNYLPTLLVMGGIVGYMVQVSFVFDSINTYIPLVILLGLGIFMARDSKQNLEKEPLRLSANAYLAALLSIALLLLVSVFTLNVPQILKNKQFVASLTATKFAQDPASLLAMTEQIESINENGVYLGTYELRQVTAETLTPYLNLVSVDPVVGQRLLEIGLNGLEKSTVEQPDNARHFGFLTNYLLTTANFDAKYHVQNLDVIRQGIELSPTRTPFWMSLGRVYIGLGENDKAIESFEKAVELSPNVTDVQLNLLAGYATVGDDKIDEQIEFLRNTESLRFTFDNYITFARILRVAEKPEAAIEVIEEAELRFPNEPLLIAELAKAYNDIGNKEKALEFARQATELDPQFQDLVDNLE